ncbi:transketolase [Litchfieldella rifensis]|uniref:Transketolase n=1 Tax=Litchfieldella rifensis TaxID=762643 RepID=A0ABV7LMF8_9GAMM
MNEMLQEKQSGRLDVTDHETRRLRANALRFLAIDAVEAANSGHPGMPMGMADIAEVLWCDFLKHNPGNPQWPDRDRFVLSNGHGSMLLYGLLHLSGYDLPLEELKRFRQSGSKTPGHPEYGHTPGVETTTGPLGQGLANAVGMALAERELVAEFNRPGHEIVDHRTYAFVGDGCLMEGISHEACSLAGVLGLGKLTVFYDDNGISIDGNVSGWFRDDTPMRFASYGWHVVAGVDGHDPTAIAMAIREAAAETTRPSLICCRTVIGYGSPGKGDSAGVHGAALGDEEVEATRQALQWPHPPFEIPAKVRSAWDARLRGVQAEREWHQRFAAYRSAFPDAARELQRRLSGNLPEAFTTGIRTLTETLAKESKPDATRKHSGRVLEAVAAWLPELFGGSADLTGSNNTGWPDMCVLGTQPERGNGRGRYVHYGVREFGMAGVMNGVSLHGGYRPFGGTFLIFSDYMRNGMRMSALMERPVIYVLTHDSIALGEDGPTHQPIEQLGSLRAIPNLTVYRPADAVETAVGWRLALESRSNPVALILTRQKTMPLVHSSDTIDGAARGAYVLSEAEGGEPDGILIASGSEVGLCLEAQARLAEAGCRVRVVSMPSWELFDAQESTYREAVLPATVKRRLVVEAAEPQGWERYLGEQGRAVGIHGFGASAPGTKLLRKYGFTVERIVAAYESLA